MGSLLQLGQQDAFRWCVPTEGRGRFTRVIWERFGATPSFASTSPRCTGFFLGFGYFFLGLKVYSVICIIPKTLGRFFFGG